MKAAVLREFNMPLSIENLVMQYPQHSIGVKVTCAGICGAQLQEINGHKGSPEHLPHLLGHEGCGIVEHSFDSDKFSNGDKVVIHWRKGIGNEFVSGGWKDEFGTYSGVKFGPCACFSEHASIAENRLTRIPDDFPDDLACLLGCSLSTALGVVENEAKVKLGESVLVIGCGGVGLALILASKLANAWPIIAIDVADKSEIVQQLGAQFYSENPYEKFDVIIDTTGTMPELDALGPSGRYIMVGQPNGTIDFALSTNFFSGDGQQIKATQGGCFSPSKDIPRYVQLWRSGALDDYKKLITHRIALEEINEGIELMRQGKAGRVLIEMDRKSIPGCGIGVRDWKASGIEIKYAPSPARFEGLGV